MSHKVITKAFQWSYAPEIAGIESKVPDMHYARSVSQVALRVIPYAMNERLRRLVVKTDNYAYERGTKQWQEKEKLDFTLPSSDFDLGDVEWRRTERIINDPHLTAIAAAEELGPFCELYIDASEGMHLANCVLRDEAEITSSEASDIRRYIESCRSIKAFFDSLKEKTFDEVSPGNADHFCRIAEDLWIRGEYEALLAVVDRMIEDGKKRGHYHVRESALYKILASNATEQALEGDALLPYLSFDKAPEDSPAKFCRYYLGGLDNAELLIEENASQSPKMHFSVAPWSQRLLLRHLQHHFGAFDARRGREYSEYFQVPLVIVPASEDRPYHLIATTATRIPYSGDADFAEIMVTLPAHWKFDRPGMLGQDAWEYVFRFLSEIHHATSALFPSHDKSIDGTQYCLTPKCFEHNDAYAYLLGKSPYFSDKHSICRLYDGTRIKWLTLVAMHKEELDYFLNNDVDTDRLYCQMRLSLDGPQHCMIRSNSFRTYPPLPASDNYCIIESVILSEQLRVGAAIRCEAENALDSGWRIFERESAENNDFQWRHRDFEYLPLSELRKIAPYLTLLFNSRAGSAFRISQSGVDAIDFPYA